MSDIDNTIKTGYQRYKEKDSGRIPFKEREKGAQLMEAIEEGRIKEVYVHDLSRLGRNALDVLNTVKYFTSKGVNLVSEKEGIKTLNEDGSENLIASMIIGILSTLSEWDYNKIRENQREGIAIAKAAGRYLGRKKGSGMSSEEYLHKHRKVVKLLKAKNSLRNTAKICDVSLSTVQKVKKELDRI
jgi:DNA invertase Pin-like site-specific DNA recombinase